MKYRQKTAVIEAFKWTGDQDQTEDPIWIVEAIRANTVRFGYLEDHSVVLLIDTPEGTRRANQGDYVIRGANGKIVPCAASIFEATYEAVPE